MRYWQGLMNEPLATDWVCETCGEYAGLEWGFVHAQCRCVVCHTQYTMKDLDKAVVTVPICLLKPEYKEPAKRAWQLLHMPINVLTDRQWDEAFVLTRHDKEYI